MIKSFLQNLRQIIPNFESKNYLLAVSGGIDSMAMVELFQQTKLQFSVAHCNFQLRDNDSFLDEELVTKTIKEIGKTLFIKRFDTKNISIKNKESIQITARKIRYQWFNELIVNNKYDFIVTGHHANDNLETAIYKLAKGTGIKGLRGILPLQNKILRPLLNFTKNQLVTYATANKIIWREDSSNNHNKYRRNFIRHQIIPLLEELNPKAVLNFSQTTERLRLAEQVLNEKIYSLKKDLIIKENETTYSIAKNNIKNHKITTPLLFELLTDFEFSYSTCDSIIQNIDSISGKTYQSNTEFTLLNDRDDLIISRANNKVISGQIPIQVGDHHIGGKTLSISILTYHPTFKFERNKNIAYFSADTLKGEFEFRNWEIGDKIYPFGMKGQQKISDILINQKVPLHLKKKELVLLYKGKIIWLLGRRASNLYKTSNSSILKLHVKENI